MNEKSMNKNIEREKDLSLRINEKMQELVKHLEEFSEFEIPKLEDYRNDFKIKAACERYFEKIIESIISITFFIIRLKKFTSPESEEHAFIILSKNNVISEDLAKRLKDAKDMRNRIIHNYITIDDTIVYNSITEEIIKDAEEFLGYVRRLR